MTAAPAVPPAARPPTPRAPADEPALRIRGLTKRYGDRTAVDAVDLEVRRGAAVGLLGPNGAGKTTLMRAALGLTRPTAGSVELLGLPQPSGRAAALGRIGALIEEPRFHPQLTGRENLEVAAAARGRVAAQRIDAVAARVGLLDRAGDRVGGYSLGMRQRLGLARGLLSDPELLVLDEPTNGLDPPGMAEVRRLIRELADEGRAVLVSSHLLDEVEKTCDDVVVLQEGRVVAAGAVDDLGRRDTVEVLVGVGAPERAGPLLQSLARVHAVSDRPDGVLAVTVAADDAAAVPELARTLVGAGLDVHRIEPVRRSLEQRFLDLVSPGGAR